jgi:hypothetical protein
MAFYIRQFSPGMPDVVLLYIELLILLCDLKLELPSKDDGWGNGSGERVGVVTLTRITFLLPVTSCTV